MAENAPEARIVFKATGGVLSSRDTHIQRLPHGIGAVGKRGLKHPVKVSGNTYAYDFGEIKFNYSRGRVYVSEDRNPQAKEIWIGGAKVGEGFNLRHKLFVFQIPFEKPKAQRPKRKSRARAKGGPSKRAKGISAGISSSMISWNEANTIDLALKSIAGFVDEVIIVDTGSFDGTRKIAREWMDALNLSGEVKQVKVKNLAQAHLESLKLCERSWVLIQDSNLVLSDPLKAEIRAHIKAHPKHQLSIKSLNLIGDYEHYFKALPFNAHHKILVRRGVKWSQNTERQYFDMPEMNAKKWAVNLSRVRPAWRSWYRGEPFSPEKYAPAGSKPGAEGHMHELNRQYQWHKQTRYTSLVEFVKATMGLSLNDVKKIAPAWYLKYTQTHARSITRSIRRGLPKVIHQEQKDPRYKLIRRKGRKGRKGKITGRWPEL